MIKRYKIIDINLYSFQLKFVINGSLEQVQKKKTLYYYHLKICINMYK